MILEAIVTTLNEDGSLTVAPMGPVVPDAGADDLLEHFDLKPFETATTFANLMRTGCGVLHVTDDVELFAKAAIGKLDSSKLETKEADRINGRVMPSACRHYEFKVETVHSLSPRAVFKCKVFRAVRNRDFFGFNRAKHAVIEAAILATRISFLPIDEIKSQYNDLRTIVVKTGGQQENDAFALLDEFVRAAGQQTDQSTVVGNAGA